MFPNSNNSFCINIYDQKEWHRCSGHAKLPGFNILTLFFLKISSLFCLGMFCLVSSLHFQSSMELVALLLLLFLCLVTVNVLWFFPVAPRAALHCAIMAFPDHTHLLFEDNL